MPTPNLARLVQALFPKQGAKLQLLRPQALDRVSQGLRGAMGQPRDYWQQGANLVGPGQMGLYFGAQPGGGLGQVSREQFLQGARPRPLRAERGYVLGLSSSQAEEMAMDRLHESGVWDEIAHEVVQEDIGERAYDQLLARMGGEHADAVRAREELDHHFNRLDGHIDRAVRDSRAFDRAIDNVTENRFLDPDDSGRSYNEYATMQRLVPQAIMHWKPAAEYFEAVVKDPALSRGRYSHWFGQASGTDEGLTHFSNLGQLGHVRGTVVPDMNAVDLGYRELPGSVYPGPGLLVEELQSDPVETLGKVKGDEAVQQSGLLPGLTARLRNPHHLLASAALERAAQVPGLRYFGLPTAEHVGSIRDRSPGMRRFLEALYGRELQPLRDRLQPARLESTNRWDLYDLDQARPIIYDQGLPYRKGGLARCR